MENRHELVFMAVSLTTALLTLITIIGKYEFFAHLDVRKNHRLLNSARAWIDHGFWNLGGFLNFQYEYTGQHRENLWLYKSHSPLYVIPHYLGLSYGGDSGFWLVVGWQTILSVLIFSVAIAVVAIQSTASLLEAGSLHGMTHRAVPWVAGASAFSIAISSEPLWSLAWDIFDGSVAIILLVVAAAFSMAGVQRSFQSIAVLFLLLASLSCGRFGVILGIAMLTVRFIWPKGEELKYINILPFRSITAFFVLCLGVSHYIRVFVYEKFFGFTLGGQEPLYRMGLTHIYEEAGQNDIDYHTPLSAFTFLWRQSGSAIGSLPAWMNTYHFIVWCLAITIFTVVVIRKRLFPEKPFWELFLVVPLTWTVLLNQSAAEHPQLVAILWLPAYVLGLSTSMACLYGLLAARLSRSASLWICASLMYMLFLWQLQYLLRAYPQLIR